MSEFEAAIERKALKNILSCNLSVSAISVASTLNKKILPILFEILPFLFVYGSIEMYLFFLWTSNAFIQRSVDANSIS